MSYSVIIPAFNEADFIESTIEVLRRSMSGVDAVGEIIVVDNNSTDDTAERALKYGTRIVFEPINQIARARNTGAKAAIGDYLIFLDADTRVDSGVLAAAVNAMRNNRCCGGGAAVDIQHPNRMANIVTDLWRWLSKSAVLAAGCFLFARRDAFRAVGGFSEKVYASEEIWLSLALRKWGKYQGFDFVVLEQPVTTSARKVDWLSTGDIFKQALVLLLFPFAIFSRRWCRAWYERPVHKRTGSN